jgi:hypothetical protein
MNLFFIALLVVLWWVALWGIIDHFASKLKHPILFYTGLLIAISLLLWINPELLEHFV